MAGQLHAREEWISRSFRFYFPFIIELSSAARIYLPEIHGFEW